MSEPEIRSFTASDGYAWQYRLFKANEPRGDVVLLHGIQSHGGWYLGTCQWLRSQKLNSTHYG